MTTLGSRLEQFIHRCSALAYTEGPDSIAFHSAIAQQVWDRVKPFILPADGKSILDVGCANGFALEMFRRDGFTDLSGITISKSDANEAWIRGINCISVLDLHELDGECPVTDLVWARHVMEHSPVPLFALEQIRSVLRPGTGKLYVEVPAPDTPCLHTTNANHFSCFERNGWEGLFGKAGFTPLMSFEIGVRVPAGDDKYYCWLLGLK